MSSGIVFEQVSKSFPAREERARRSARTGRGVRRSGSAGGSGPAGANGPTRHANSPVRKGGSADFAAIADVSLEIRAGEFLAVVGPSGCGKSTLLDLLGGLTTPTTGRILVDGEPVSGPGLDRGVVFQQYALLPWRTAQANVEFGLEAKRVPRRERRERARDYLSLVGLDGFAGHYPHELSGGMRQRVAIARSLAFDPGVLLMDEPFGALDAQTRELLQEELLRIWQRTGKTVVFITHGIDEAVYLGERVAVLTARPGRIKEVVTVELPDRGGDADVRSSPEFARHRHAIWSLLRDEAVGGGPGAEVRSAPHAEGEVVHV